MSKVSSVGPVSTTALPTPFCPLMSMSKAMVTLSVVPAAETVTLPSATTCIVSAGSPVTARNAAITSSPVGGGGVGVGGGAEGEGLTLAEQPATAIPSAITAVAVTRAIFMPPMMTAWSPTRPWPPCRTNSPFGLSVHLDDQHRAGVVVVLDQDRHANPRLARAGRRGADEMGAVRRLLHPVVLAQDLEDLPSADASQRIAIAKDEPP